MRQLTRDDFSRFFRAVHEGCDPFPWQERLAARLLQVPQLVSSETALVVKNTVLDFHWPEPICLPTGSGKTTCLDLAVFDLAAQADKAPAQRSSARRIFYVVDRRVVVDEAFDHARQMAGLLEHAKSGILYEVAERLRHISGETDLDVSPLAVAQLRGGVYRDHAWARTPTQPTIICTTVDQLGSRLLFRGYGVSAAARPIHAALATHDSLIFLDEAHLAEPFLETLRAVHDYRKFGDRSLNHPFQVVVLSATPPKSEESSPQPFKLETADNQHPILGPRLAAVKLASLNIASKAKGKNFIKPLAEELTSQAIALAGESPRAIVIFANRVATARETANQLRKRFGDRADVLLFTGRMRPFDRDQLAETWLPLLRPTNKPRSFGKPIFVVATQTLEVGANLDFDALVTECASLSSLRQRFGRLNRGGRPGGSSAAIVIRADQLQMAEIDEESDPVYGNSLSATWLWLQRQNEGRAVDFGILDLNSRLDRLTDKECSVLNLTPSHAPTMFPAHLDCWVQTAPMPCPSPDVGIFLHGPGCEESDVMVCWRVDLPEDNINLWGDILALIPPAVGECLTVPIYRFRTWIQTTSIEDDLGADVPIQSSIEKKEANTQSTQLLKALRWNGVEDSEPVTDINQVRPGDLIVLSGEAAKKRNELGDFPPETPIDVGDAMQLIGRSRPILRLNSAVMETWKKSPAIFELAHFIFDKSPDELAGCLSDRHFIDELRSLLLKLASEKPDNNHSWLHTSADWLAKELGSRSCSRRVLHPHPNQGIILRSVHRMPRFSNTTDDFAGEDDTGSASEAVSLQDHSLSVARCARNYASICGFPEAIQNAIELAGWFHDIGKSDPRFQLLLRGGSRRGMDLLAKSVGFPISNSVRNAVANQAGYPHGGRHELLSVKLSEPLITLQPPELQDLILHLIASSHGHCRPFAPIIIDESPVDICLRWSPTPELPLTNETEIRRSSTTDLEHLSSCMADRFWRLTRRHGWWGLAMLESILLLADHRTSESEEYNSAKEIKS